TAADRRIGTVVNFAAAQVRQVRIEQCGERAQNAALRLAAQSKKNEVVPRKDSVDNPRHNCVVVADNAGEYCTVRTDADHKIVAHLVLDAPAVHPWFGKLLAATKVTQCLRKIAQGLDTSQGYGTPPQRRTVWRRMFVFYACHESCACEGSCPAQ